MPFNPVVYNSGNVYSSDGNFLPTGVFSVSVTTTGVTSGINIKVTVTNLTSGNQLGLRYYADLGWGLSGVNPMPTHVWVPDPSFSRDAIVTGFTDVRANFYGGNNYTSLDINRCISSSCMVFEHVSGRAIGLSTNYPSTFRLLPRMSGSNLQLYMWGFMTGTHPTYGSIVPQDFFTSGSSITFDVWLREHSGSTVTTGVALNLCQPYFDWMSVNFPNRRNSIKSDKRIYGFFMAVSQSSGNPRSYGKFGSGLDINPWENTTDWYKIFDSLPKPAELKAKGFDSLLFWNPAGTVPGLDFPSITFVDLPSHLKDKAWQVSEWGRRNNLKVLSYHGSSWAVFQVSSWNEPMKFNFTPRQGYMGVDYTFAQAVKAGLDVTGVNAVKANVTNGWMNFSDGMGMDALPSITQFPFLSGAYSELRATHPNKVLFSENFVDDRTQSYFLSSYYPYNQWDGIKCPLLQRLYGESNAYIIINQYDYPNPATAGGRAAFASGVYQAETAGLVPIILCDSTAFNLLSYSGVSTVVGVDKFDKKSGKRLR
jgi:hypothetical protein